MTNHSKYPISNNESHDQVVIFKSDGQDNSKQYRFGAHPKYQKNISPTNQVQESRDYHHGSAAAFV